MAVNKLNPHQQIKVKEIISSVFLFNGNAPKAIEKIEQTTGVTLSIQQIYYYLKQIKEEEKQKTAANAEEIKAKELKKLDYLESEVIEQWDKSKLNAETVTTKTLGIEEKPAFNTANKKGLTDFDGDPREAKLEVKTEETLKRSGQCGDPRYIDNLIRLSKRRSELLGLDAPTKKEISISHPKPLTEMSNAELSEYISEIESSL